MIQIVLHVSVTLRVGETAETRIKRIDLILFQKKRGNPQRHTNKKIGTRQTLTGRTGAFKHWIIREEDETHLESY